MHNNKLLKILASFSEEEFRSFKKALQSPFFSGNPHLLPLYQYLKRYYPAFDSPKLMKIYLFRHLFPTRVYSDIKLRNLFREMTRLAEDFIVYQELQQQTLSRNQLLLDGYYRRNITDLFDREANKVDKTLKELPFRDMDYFHQKYQLNLSRLDVLPSKALVQRFQLLVQNQSILEQYYLLSKTKLDTELESFQGILATHQLAGATNNRQEADNGELLLQMYEQIQNLYRNSSLEAFAAVRKQLVNHIDKIRPKLQIELLMHLINFTIRQMKEDDQLYNQLTFELYQFGLEKDILVQDGQLHDTAFLNIAVAGAKARAFEWTSQFLVQYASYVAETIREDVKTLGLANLNFHRGQFLQAIEDLNQHPIIHPLYLISARTHTLRCYYELFVEDSSYYDLLIAQTQAFEKFMRRSKVYNDTAKRACLNFVAIVSRLANLRVGQSLSTSDQAQIYQKLQEQEHTVSRSWLLEKIQQ